MQRFCVILLIAASFFSCSKKDDPTPAPTPEANIAFTIDAVNNSISTGSSFPVTVTLTSVMPSKGIKIEATVTDQTNNANIAQTAITSSTTKNTYTLTGLPQGHWCNVVIKVSSVATTTNSATQSFTVAFK